MCLSSIFIIILSFNQIDNDLWFLYHAFIVIALIPGVSHLFSEISSLIRPSTTHAIYPELSIFISTNFSASVGFHLSFLTLNLDLLYGRVYAKKVRCKTEVVLILDTIISL